MFSSAASSVLGVSVALLASLINAAPLDHSARTTSPIYYLSNCYNTGSSTAWAEIDYYTSKTLAGTHVTPSAVSILNPTETIDYDDNTSFASTPFVLTVALGFDSYTAAVGSVVGSATTGAGKTLKCYRDLRATVYVPRTNFVCTADYSCY